MVDRLVSADSETGLLPDVVLTNLGTRFPTKTASYTKTEADARFSPIGTGASAALKQRFDTAGEALSAKLEMGAGGNIVLTLLSDSTGAPDNGWYKLWAQEMAAAHPKLRVEYTLWDDAAQAYPAATVLQQGEYSASGVSDSFGRTSSSLSGTTPETGGAWTGANSFSLNGFKAVATAVLGEVVSSAGVTGDSVTTATGVSIDTTPGTGAKQIKILSKYASASDHLYAFVNIATTGIDSWGIFKRIAGAPVVVANGGSSTLGLTANSVNTFDMSLSVQGLNVSATINGKTVTGTITQSDADVLASSTSGGLATAGSASIAGAAVDGFTYTVSGAPSVGQKLTMYNGSQGGTTFGYGTSAYHLAVAGRLQKMVPVRPDIAIMNMGHNYLEATPAAFVSDINAMVAALRALYSGVGIVASSQNPRFTPAVSIAPHLDRIVALRILALQNGWGYLPVYETFAARTDGGKSLVLTDGVHPGTEGRAVWRSVASNYLAAHSLSPA